MGAEASSCKARASTIAAVGIAESNRLGETRRYSFSIVMKWRGLIGLPFFSTSKCT